MMKKGSCKTKSKAPAKPKRGGRAAKNKKNKMTVGSYKSVKYSLTFVLKYVIIIL